MAPESIRPIIVVTGANSGVGFGICQRLLEQLTQQIPPDSLLSFSKDQPKRVSHLCNTKSLTLVLACRNAERANKARDRLLRNLDVHVDRLKRLQSYDGHAEIFRKNLRIDLIPLDLSRMESVFAFIEEAERRYSYISHLVLNAGVLNVVRVDFILAFKQMAKNYIESVTTPKYLIQAEGLESPDGLGLVFQSNVLGHFCLVRNLNRLLRANPSLDSRVQWISSLDACPELYNQEDVQLRRHKHAYEASKYQSDLICTTLSLDSAAHPRKADEADIRYFLTTPGVCHTENTVAILTVFQMWAKLLSFYIARLLGSSNHPITAYKGATAPVYGIVASPETLKGDATNFTKITSKSTLFGTSYVGTAPVFDWDTNAEHAADLVAYCDRLVNTFKLAQKGPSPDTDSGIEVS